MTRADAAVSDAVSWMSWRPYAATAFLVALCVGLYFPGIASLPVVDRDEPRFAQASKQMVETGDFIDIRFQNEPRYKKPIGIYWLQAVPVALAHKLGADLNEIWAYRIPSFLGATAAVLLLFWLSRPIVGRRTALIASALFAAAFTMAFEARIAKSDAALTATLVLTQLTLFRLFLARDRSQTRGLAALFWLGLGASILIKGPIGPAVAIFTAAGVIVWGKHRRWLANLHWRWGVPLLLVVVLPWFIAIGISSGGAFFKSSVGQDFAGKLQSGQEAHWGPPGFYIALFAWTFWPLAIVFSKSAFQTFWRARRQPRMTFLLCWAVPFWLVLEIIPTKLPHYGLPVYAAFALAFAITLQATTSPRPAAKRRIGPIIWAVVAVLQFVFLTGALWLFEAPVPLLLVILLAAYCVVAVAAVTEMWSSRIKGGVAAAILAAILIYTAAFRFVLPGADAAWLSQRAYDVTRTFRGCGSLPVALGGYNEPSAIFMNGTPTIVENAEGTAASLADGKASIAIVRSAWAEQFEAGYRAKSGTPPRFLGCVDGLNFNGRGPLRLDLYAASNAPASCQPTPATECAEKRNVRWRRILDTKF